MPKNTNDFSEISALARGYELMFRTLSHIAGTSGHSCHWYSHKAQEIIDQVVPLWKLNGKSNKERPGDCLTQTNSFLTDIHNSKINLLPCPFCGGEAERIDIPDKDDGDCNAGGSCIQCKNCLASTALYFDRKENLVSLWNKRTTPKLSLKERE
jgi:Lar family restriction alleviation protein